MFPGLYPSVIESNSLSFLESLQPIVRSLHLWRSSSSPTSPPVGVYHTLERWIPLLGSNITLTCLFENLDCSSSHRTRVYKIFLVRPVHTFYLIFLTHIFYPLINPTHTSTSTLPLTTEIDSLFPPSSSLYLGQLTCIRFSLLLSFY